MKNVTCRKVKIKRMIFFYFILGGRAIVTIGMI